MEALKNHRQFTQFLSLDGEAVCSDEFRSDFVVGANDCFQSMLIRMVPRKEKIYRSMLIARPCDIESLPIL